MRSLAPWFIVTVGGLFVLFMVLSDSKLSDALGRRSNDIGKVNGEKISYQEFANLLDRYREFQLKQNGQEIPESQMDQFRDQVWESIISQKLMEQKIREYDLTVSDTEIRDVLLGPNPPQSVTQYFIDSTGRFNREAYDAAIRNPQNKTAILQIEDQVKQQILQEKLSSLVNASAFVTDEEIKRKFDDDNVKMNADYILVTVPMTSDSTLNATEDEIKDYYSENKNEYKKEETRKIKYVLFKTGASHADTIAIKNNLSAILEKVLVDSSGFKTFVEIYSEKPYSKDTLQVSQIPLEAQDLVINSKVGAFVGPVLTNEGFILYKVNNSIDTKETLVKASHILIKDEAQANVAYKELLAGADFAKMAIEKSEDPGSGKNGGSLGWFGKGQMVTEFDKAAFDGKIGKIQSPIKTQFGWHIIRVEDKTNKKYVVESIVNKVVASPTTVDKIYNNANDFQFLAEENGFETTAKELDYQVVETPELLKAASSIPGLGSNRSLLLYTFDNDVDDVTPAFKFQSGYVVAMISEISDAGFKPLDEVKDNIKLLVTKEKKGEKELTIAKEIKAKIGENGDFNLAKEAFPQAKIGTTTSFSTSGSIPNLGRDFAFSQKAYELPVNKVSEPFKGNRGSYIIKVIEKTPFDSTAFSIQKNSIRTSLLNQKKSALYSQWLVDITKEADIVDNRYQFYR
ncbi:MAG: peptidylprolyl isomerase [Bacteroidetes bacterium]|nr:peptidylprolyl isomerase [Bacteroidota bacterium]MBU1113748.1 peptidylprolyl isomerase [Bacteroidota bacterium]